VPNIGIYKQGKVPANQWFGCLSFGVRPQYSGIEVGDAKVSVLTQLRVKIDRIFKVWEYPFS
jgi:hypothetical protein